MAVSMNATPEEEETPPPKWRREEEEEEDVGCQPVGSCPHGSVGIMAILVSTGLFCLSAAAAGSCTFVLVDTVERNGLSFEDRRIGLYRFEDKRTDSSCLFWTSGENADRVYDSHWSAARALVWAALILTLVSAVFLCSASCYAHPRKLFQSLSFLFIFNSTLFGMSFIVFASDICQEAGSCAMSTGSIMMVAVAVLWLLTSLLLLYIPSYYKNPRSPREKPRIQFNSTQKIWCMAALIAVLLIGLVNGLIIGQSDGFSERNGTDVVSSPVPEISSPPPKSFPGSWDTIAIVPGGYQGNAISLAPGGRAIAVSTSYNPGRLSFFYQPENSLTWTVLGETGGHIGPPSFGRSLALSDVDVYAVGTPDFAVDGVAFGRVDVWFYDRDAEAWLIDGLLIGNKPNFHFGSDVAITAGADYAAITSTSMEDGASVVQGYAYSEELSWVPIGQEISLLQSSPATSGWNATSSLIISPSTGVVTLSIGIPIQDIGGMVIVWDYQPANDVWVQRGSTIDANAVASSDDGDDFGYSVALSEDGNVLAVGAPQGGNKSTGSGGHVRIFSFQAGTWQQVGQDLTCGLNARRCGESVKLTFDGKMVVIGDSGFDGGRGRVIVYQIDDFAGEWYQFGPVINGESSGGVGAKVSISRFGELVAYTDATEGSRKGVLVEYNPEE